MTKAQSLPQPSMSHPPGALPPDPGGRLLSGPPAYRPASPWMPLPAVLLTAAIVVASVTAMAVVMVLVGVAPQAGFGRVLWAMAAMQVVAVTLTLIASRRHGASLREVLALREAPRGWRSYAGAIAAVIVLQAILTAVQHFLLGNDMLADVRPVIGIVTGSHWPLAVVVMALGAPLSEELLFRGFVLGALAQSRLGFAGAALLSTAAWTVLHGYSPIGLADVFASGLLFCWLLWRTGSLRVVIFCHAVYNGAIVLALHLSVRWLA